MGDGDRGLPGKESGGSPAIGRGGSGATRPSDPRAMARGDSSGHASRSGRSGLFDTYLAGDAAGQSAPDAYAELARRSGARSDAERERGSAGSERRGSLGSRGVRIRAGLSRRFECVRPARSLRLGSAQCGDRDRGRRAPRGRLLRLEEFLRRESRAARSGRRGSCHGARYERSRATFSASRGAERSCLRLFSIRRRSGRRRAHR